MTDHVSTSRDLRRENNIDCYTNINVTTICKALKEPCLFDIENDPCELNNVARDYPEVLTKMLTELSNMRSSVVPPNNVPIDPRGDPKNWNYVWTNFGDVKQIRRNCSNSFFIML